MIINTEVRSVPVTKKGIYFAFRDQGACLSVIAVKIFYITCPNITTNFAFYPETPTGKELTTIVETDGMCVTNAQQVEIPRLLCKGDGNWTLPSGGCKCMAGYEPKDQSCQGKCHHRTFVRLNYVHNSHWFWLIELRLFCEGSSIIQCLVCTNGVVPHCSIMTFECA